MKKLCFIFIAALAALALSSCKKEEEQEERPEITVTTAETEPESNHVLVRNFTINDIFWNLYAEEKKFTFPVDINYFNPWESLGDCSFDGGRIVFPDGKYFEARAEPIEGDDSPPINYLRAEYGTAPEDFSAYGIFPGMNYYAVMLNYGMADSVYGAPDTGSGSCVYLGAGTQTFTLEFENGFVTAMIFSQVNLSK